MSPSDIPQHILQRLSEADPGAFFSGSLPRLQSTSGSIYFVKLGSASEQAQYKAEAESLKAIEEAAPSLAPRLISYGDTELGMPYFISQYKDLDQLSSNAANVLAKRLATELHAKENPSGKGFGFSIPTFCGPTKITNGWFQSWDECYASMIGDLLQQLELKGKLRYQALCKKGEIVKNEVVPKLLGALQVNPVVLHGDLWSGNAGTDQATGQPVVFDPASYYGHNEADLSIARIFGGFPDSFYKTYHEYLPKTEPVEQYELRMDLYELFHYLNHTLIFGGHYAGSAEKKMDKLLAALPQLSF